MPKSIRQQVIDMATPVSPKRIENAQTALDRLMDPERGIGDLATELHVPHELLFLYELAYGCWDDNRHSYGHIIQAGVHYGVTLCMLAQAAEHIVSPYLVYGIDPYQPQTQGDGYTYPHRKRTLVFDIQYRNWGWQTRSACVVLIRQNSANNCRLRFPYAWRS